MTATDFDTIVLEMAQGRAYFGLTQDFATAYLVRSGFGYTALRDCTLEQAHEIFRGVFLRENSTAESVRAALSKFFAGEVLT
jgi:hypothetical protein